MSIYGPRYDVSSSIDLGEITSDLDMGGNKIINLRTPRNREDAATAGYVTNYVSHLNNIKLDKSGGTMSGNLDMDHNKIVNVGVPTDETDVVNKQYVDAMIQHEHDITPHALGRYIVYPLEDGTKTYFSVRAKKNVDFDEGKILEIKNAVIHNPRNITIVSTFTLEDNPGKDLDIMRIGVADLDIDLDIPAPWSVLFSVKPEVSSDMLFNITFDRDAHNVEPQLNIRFAENIIGFRLGRYLHRWEEVNIDTTKFNHIGVEYMQNKFLIWVNGEIKVSVKNVVLGNMNNITSEIKEMGIFSLYNRDLNKAEMVQHFVDYHVMNFTNDEVLI